VFFLPVPQVGKAKGILKNFLIEPFVAHNKVLQIQCNFICFNIFIRAFHIDLATVSLIKMIFYINDDD